MAIPSQEELELDLQTLADYQRLKRNGSFPEILFLVGALRGGSGGGGSTGGGGDASAFNQTTEIARLTSIRDRLPGSFGMGGALRTDSSGVTQPVTGEVTIGNFPATQGIFGNVTVNNFPATQPISAIELPLPTDAATEVTLAEVSDRIGAIDESAATSPTAPASLGGLIRFFYSLLPAALSTDGRLKTESTFRQLTVVDDKVGATVEASVLPNGAATDSKLNEVVASLTRQGFLQDHSGSIATGGTAQAAVPQNLARKYLFIQNLSAADLWFNFGAVDASPGFGSMRLGPNATGVYELGFVPVEAVTIFGAATGQAFTIKQSFET